MDFDISASFNHPIVEGSSEKREFFLKQFILKFPQAFYICDANGVITFFNQAATDLWGLKPVVGQTRWCGSWKLYTVDGQLLSSCSNPISSVITQGKPAQSIEVILERPDGTR